MKNVDDNFPLRPYMSVLILILHFSLVIQTFISTILRHLIESFSWTIRVSLKLEVDRELFGLDFPMTY